MEEELQRSELTLLRVSDWAVHHKRESWCSCSAQKVQESYGGSCYQFGDHNLFLLPILWFHCSVALHCPCELREPTNMVDMCHIQTYFAKQINKYINT